LVGASSFGQGFECRRYGHGGRVDKGEEEDVGALLLVREQLGVPVGVAAEAGEVVGQEQIHSQNLF